MKKKYIYSSNKNIQKLKCLEHFNQFPYYKFEPNTRNKGSSRVHSINGAQNED